MTTILDNDTAHANLVLKFIGALDREDYLLCRTIKDMLNQKITENKEIRTNIHTPR